MALMKFKRVTSYEDAKAELSSGWMPVARKKIAHNTWLRRGEGDSYEVVYHSTAIVTYYPNGEIKLNSGRWQTVTTKQRMNLFTPAWLRVYQDKFDWFVYCDGVEMPFEDGDRYACAP